MALTIGQRMLRTDDGMRGEVKERSAADPSPAIWYLDRGEPRMATGREDWVPIEEGRGALRMEEIGQLARISDHWLMCAELHLPWVPGLPPDRLSPPHDPGLVSVITRYLQSRV